MEISNEKDIFEKTIFNQSSQLFESLIIYSKDEELYSKTLFSIIVPHLLNILRFYVETNQLRSTVNYPLNDKTMDL